MQESGEIGAANKNKFAVLLAVWVDAACRFAWPIVLLVLIISAVAAYYTATNFRMNTDTADMISNELPFRRDYLEYKRAFPQFSDNLVVVLDGPSADAVDEAARALAARLATDHEHFQSVFYPQGEPFFRRNGLLYLDLDELNAQSQRLADAQPLLSTLANDMSLRGLFEVLNLALEQAAEGDEAAAALDPVLGAANTAVDAHLAGRDYRIPWSELMRGDADAAGERRRILVLQAKPNWQSLKPAAEAMEAVRSEATAAGLAENDIRLRMTGSAALNTEELESIEDGAGLSAALTSGLVLGLLMLGLRSLRLVAATLVTLFAGLIWTAAFAIAAIGHFNMISVAFAVLFIGLGVDFSIHFALRYQEDYRDGTPHEEALRRAALGVGFALTLCAVSAAISFFSFVPTAYTGVAELGLISGVGMFFALLANLLLLPALLTVLPKRGRGERPPSERRLSAAAARGIDRFIARHSRAVVAVALAAGVAATAVGSQIRFDFDPFKLKDPSKESVQTALDLMRSGESEADSLSIVASDLNQANILAAKVGALPEVSNAITLADFVPANQDQKLAVIENMALFLVPVLVPTETRMPPTVSENLAALEEFRNRLAALAGSPGGAMFETDVAALEGKVSRLRADIAARPASAGRELAQLSDSLLHYLPDQLAALRQSLEARRVSIDDLPGELRNRYIARDGRARIEVSPARPLDQNAERRNFVEAVRRVAPGATDSSVLMLESADAIVRALRQATLTALALIVLLLGVLLRNVWDVTLVLAPLALATAYTLGAAQLSGLSLNFANVIAVPLLLGLGVASAIHLVMRSHKNRLGSGVRSVVETSTPRAVLFSALTTIGSFGSLAISSHRGTASMGMLLTLALIMTLVAALVVLPALMRLREDSRDRIGVGAEEGSKL